MSTRAGVKRNRRGGNNRRRRGGGLTNRSAMAGTRNIVRPLDFAIPKTSLVRVVNVTRVSVNQATSTYANKQLLVCSIGGNFDPNTSTTQTNLKLIQQMYDRYRVVAVRTRAEFWSADNVCTEVFMGYSNDSVSVNNANIATYATNPSFKRKLLPSSSVAGSRTSIVLPRIEVRDFIGSNVALFDDNFVAPTNGSGTPTSPANNLYMIYGVVTLNSVLTNGVYFDITTVQEVEFFERTLQLT